MFERIDYRVIRIKSQKITKKGEFMFERIICKN